MLTAEQVIPFFSSDDPILREQAYFYFRDASNFGPLTAVDYLATFDQIGITQFNQYRLSLFSDLTQSDASTFALLAALDIDTEPRPRDYFVDLLENIDFNQLLLHREAIFARPDLSDKTRQYLQTRLEFSEAPPELLWQRFDQHALASEEEYWDKIDHKNARRVLEALARHGQSSADKATAILCDPKYKDTYREIQAIELLRRLRHRPALELLINRFADSDEDADVLHEALQNALPVIGGVDIVAPIEALFLKRSWTFRIYASEMLARVKDPASEAALLRLIEKPYLDDTPEHLANALAELCTTDGLPKLQRIVVEDDYDHYTFDLKKSLVACALMAGFDFSELPQLREEVVHEETHARLRQQEAQLRAQVHQLEQEIALTKRARALRRRSRYGDDPAEPVPTIVNQQPKIGRNDPCPCGSGKKYKKCCLNKQ